MHTYHTSVPSLIAHRPSGSSHLLTTHHSSLITHHTSHITQVLLVGVPSTFPERGGTAQLFWGLLVCFATFGAYMMYAPFIEDSDDKLSQLAQLQIFLTLLSSLALSAVPPSEVVGQLVTVILFLVPLLGVALETPLLEVLGQAFGVIRGAFVKLFPNFKPPTFEPSTTDVLAPKLPRVTKKATLLSSSSTTETSTAGSVTTESSAAGATVNLTA